MTLAEAVAVLNARKHKGYAWSGGDDGAVSDSHGDDPFHQLDAFEVLAIAEKYERQGSLAAMLGTFSGPVWDEVCANLEQAKAAERADAASAPTGDVAARLAALAELTAEAQAMGLYETEQ